MLTTRSAFPGLTGDVVKVLYEDDLISDVEVVQFM